MIKLRYDLITKDFYPWFFIDIQVVVLFCETVFSVKTVYN